MRITFYAGKVYPIIVLLLFVLLTSCSNDKSGSSSAVRSSIKVELDREIKVGEKVINSSTQSLNRYSSKLRGLTEAHFEHRVSDKKLNFALRNSETNSFLDIDNIDIEFICPQLPYADIKQDKFDIANLILAEYSRNGIGIPIQENDLYASVKHSDDLFDKKGEYIFENGTYQPNPSVLPKRISLINNCLRPCLWEFSASDAVGEMYHGWFELEHDFYMQIVENQTGISKELIPSDFNNPSHFDKVVIDFDRFRKLGAKLGESATSYNDSKILGGYSTQDSRRKVQRNFFEIHRNNEPVKIESQADLEEGDEFAMFSFQEPGIYDPANKMKTKFNRSWSRAEVYRTEPLTRYDEKQEFLPSDYIEIKVYDEEGKNAIILGNIPLALLSFKNDFIIPAFGVGVFQSSEPVERRLLRTTMGPRPSFAYLARVAGDNFEMINNHLDGYEQIFLRPIDVDGKILLRVTLVSYERITDLIEFDIDIDYMSDEIKKNSAKYRPPIYQTYQDDNTI